MKKRWIILLVAGLCLPLLIAVAGDRTFGPEWKKVTFPNTGTVEYQRSIEVKVTHPPAEGASHYTVPLENGTLNILEEDGNRGLELRVDNKQGYQGGVGFGTDEGGKPSSYWVRFGHMEYYDFNGDGILDARFDEKSQQPFIMFDGRDIPVEHTKDHFKRRKKRSLDQKTTYVFVRGKWSLEK